MSPQRCRQPGCTGWIEDGYCNVCGTPESAAPLPTQGEAVSRASTRSASARLGTGIPQGPIMPPPPSARHAAQYGEEERPSQVASQALGSARTAAGGSRPTRRVGSTSTRLRGSRLGAGLTTVPEAPAKDPAQAIMKVPELPESRRFCPSCGVPVGRSRPGVPGRTEGFCPNCRARFSFSPQLNPGDVIGNQYEVAGCLAFGGLGWIYLARDRNVSGRWVVLKGLLNSGDPDAYAAAIAERQFLAEVEHPLIVEIYNFVMYRGAGYIVMEYVGGESLKDILRARKDANGGVVDPLPVDQALAYILEILPAFQYLHDLGLLYCDFKPDNIIQVGDSVKLIDMGGVRRVDDMDSPIYGTVGYQGPEVPEVGPSVASDIYTIGRTLATLTLDFKGNQTTYVASLPPVDSTPVFEQYDSFYRLLAKACAPDPSDRFSTVDEFRAQLLGVLREVVAQDAGPQHAALTSVASPFFESPTSDVVDRPLPWDALPLLKVDPADPMSSWLAGVNVADADARLNVLATAPARTEEVQLARARAAVEAGRYDIASAVADELLNEDPWDWRAVWVTGLAQLAAGDGLEARTSFNVVYGQLPGELAPKLALAAACEATGEGDVAESLYTLCAWANANYTAPAAFGLARIRRARGDLDGALEALDLVAPTRSSYPAARKQKAALLAASGRGLQALSTALDSVQAVQLDPRERAEFTAGVLRTALTQVTKDGAQPKVQLAGIPAAEPALRDSLEKTYRELAGLADNTAERIRFVDDANRVRRWTLR